MKRCKDEKTEIKKDGKTDRWKDEMTVLQKDRKTNNQFGSL